ncbi:glycine betaine/proline transport system permease protein [Marinilabilia salmonicolor]|jgi:glycine betaine/proline transport system permease protein|uniref:ABC transporter permease n=1 Tax=Marinilabilia salmonicolor TaxID=989 RepID=UPI000D04A1EE|nr:proline/glycine betaine ABC transporter permease [Marinilabilia salmonicolor]PRZ02064.1 glycine betaine/proline transport system permease protein [Marinilabilia salmonicolor]
MEKLDIGKYIESAIDSITQHAGPVLDGIALVIEGIVDGLQNALLSAPSWLIMILMALIAYYVQAGGVKPALTKKGFKKAFGLAIFTVIGLFLLLWMDYWEETMQTLALVLASAFLALLTGIPLGIWAARNSKADQVIRPVLDFMQTMPAFVYLIPAILFFSVGNVPGVVATVVFSLPPAVRLTSLGIRGVPEEVVEAAQSFGSTKRQLLFKVQIPLAMPTILAGVNQVIMLALSMVVIASMVGAAGLGERVYSGILQAKVGLGFEAGLGIVILAIILDRVTQALGGLGKK